MLFAKFFDDLSARCGFIAQNLAPDCALEGFDYSRWKTLWICRKRPSGDDAAHLPMPCRCVLAARTGSRATEYACGSFDRLDGQGANVGESHRAKIWNLDTARRERVA